MRSGCAGVKHVHNRTDTLQTRVEQHQDRQLGPILFEGQGISRVFETHRKNLHDKLSKGNYRTDVPEIEAIARRLDATASRVDEVISEFNAERATLCLAQISDKRAIRDEAGKTQHLAVDWFNGLYDNVFTTVAFQSAVVCGFFVEAEKVPKDASPALDRLAAFDEYISQLNEFFLPRTLGQFKKLVRVFTGEVVGDTVGEWKISQSNQTFRNVVYRGEMQPDQWPKYKYLLMEI